MSEAKKIFRFVCMSDTHVLHPLMNIPKGSLINMLMFYLNKIGDVLIHAGDFAQKCKDESHIVEFNKWIGTLDFKHKIVIAG